MNFNSYFLSADHLTCWLAVWCWRIIVTQSFELSPPLTLCPHSTTHPTTHSPTHPLITGSHSAVDFIWAIKGDGAPPAITTTTTVPLCSSRCAAQAAAKLVFGVFVQRKAHSHTLPPRLPHRRVAAGTSHPEQRVSSSSCRFSFGGVCGVACWFGVRT